jgi:MSHA biogenesis protein MshE
MVAMSLSLVLAQRLLRVVCENCTQTHVPTAQEQEWLHTEMDGQQDGGSFAKGQGCSQCNGTGYVGRTGIYEMLEMTHALVEAANHKEPGEFVRLAQQQIGKATLMHDAVRLALTGRTTIDEAMRVSVQLDD